MVQVNKVETVGGVTSVEFTPTLPNHEIEVGDIIDYDKYNGGKMKVLSLIDNTLTVNADERDLRFVKPGVFLFKL